jgi:hypothetical protein
MPAPPNYDNQGNLLKDETKLFIANLGYQTDNPSLEKFFSQFGHVRFAKVVYDKDDKSRGFGFVWMMVSVERRGGEGKCCRKLEVREPQAASHKPPTTSQGLGPETAPSFTFPTPKPLAPRSTPPNSP